MMRKYCMTLIFMFFSFSALAEPLAIKGYDVVSYFSGVPSVGVKQYSQVYNGKTYYFKNIENQKRFQKNPTEYLPQYEGYCAFGVKEGKKLVTDPLAWDIVGGKLYLNLNKRVQTIWQPKKVQFIDEADERWLQIKDIPKNKL